MSQTFGYVLRQWRKQKRYSQLQLSLELGVSSKHISFLETQRAKPSQEMILKIGTFLLMSKREINRALLIAGYAPVYADLSISHENLKPVISAIEHMIMSHMPYPALVLDQNWDVINANDTAKLLLLELGFSEHQNLIEALLAYPPAESKIINWRETIQAVLMRLRHEINMLGNSLRLEKLEEKLTLRLADFDNVNGVDDAIIEPQLIMSTKLKIANKVLSFFSLIAQLGTIQDINVSGFQVELMFPSDEITKAFCEGLK